MEREESPRGPMSEEDAIASLMESDDQPEDVIEDETDEDEPEAEDAPEVEDDLDDAEDGETDEDESEEVEEDEDDDPLIVIQTKRGQEKVKFSELQDGYLRMKDYTQKTQALGSERQEFEAQKAKVTQAIRQQEAQLQEALATFAIDQEQEPDWANVKPEEYPRKKAEWDARLRKKQQATEYYRALQQRNQEETLQREQQALLELFPEWRDPVVFKQVAEDFVALGGDYGFAADEMAAITDHRYFRLLNDLKAARAMVNVAEQNKTAIAKRVAKAAKKPAPGSKPAKNQDSQKALQKKRERLLKTGSPEAAVAFLMGD